jgi:hypothetical protein
MKRAGEERWKEQDAVILYYIEGMPLYIYIIDEVGDGGHPLLHLVCVYSSIASRSSSEKPMFM